MNVKRIAIIRLFILVLPLIILLDCGKAEREKKEPLTAGKTVKEESIKILEEKEGLAGCYARKESLN